MVNTVWSSRIVVKFLINIWFVFIIKCLLLCKVMHNDNWSSISMIIRRLKRYNSVFCLMCDLAPKNLFSCLCCSNVEDVLGFFLIISGIINYCLSMRHQSFFFYYLDYIHFSWINMFSVFHFADFLTLPTIILHKLTDNTWTGYRARKHSL